MPLCTILTKCPEPTGPQTADGARGTWDDPRVPWSGRPQRLDILGWAAIVLSGSVYFCYAHAPGIASAVSPSTAHGILRVVAFILLCIGVQIAWNGLSTLVTKILRP